nr:hypothetical protein [Dyella sp. ASV24]
MLWVVLYPRPYGVALTCAAVLPWLAIALAWLNPWQILLEEKKRFDTGLTLSWLLVAPATALSLRAALDVTTIDVRQLVLWSFVLFLPLWVGIATAPTVRLPFRSKQWGSLLLLLPFTAAYGGSLLALTNAMWDNSKPKIYKTIVVGKHMSQGKGTSYYLNLATWNKEIDKNRLQISHAYYETLTIGDTVCVSLYAGRFGVRWMQVGGCG